MAYEKSLPDMLLTAAFMAMGAESVLSKRDSLCLDSRGGYLGFYADLTKLAELSEDTLVILNRGDFPGVYDYEISEPFGVWFAENRPTDAEARAELVARISKWFDV